MMKITLLNVISNRRECVNKDINGGFGTATHIGNSLRAKFIQFMKKRGVVLPLLSLGYLAAIFRQNGHTVDYLDCGIPDSSDLVIIHSSMVDYRNELDVADNIRRHTKAKVGFIGPFSSVMPEKFIQHADFVVSGEPENAAYSIKDDFIPEGIVKSAPVEDLNKLPFPDWDDFPIDDYSYSPVINDKPFLVIQSSRGCTLKCNYYCPYTVAQGTVWRNRSFESVTEEIRGLRGKHKIRGLLFRDPLFSFNKKRATDIATNIKEFKIKWACETRLDMLDTDLLDLLYESGLRAINVGIESAVDDVLEDSKRKPINTEHQERIIKYCDDKGINVSAFYILGLKGDTMDSVNKTIEYAKRLNTHVAQFTLCTPIPGTMFFEEMKNKFLTDDWQKFDNYTPVFKHDNLTPEELSKLKEKAFISYYFRPRWLLKYIIRTCFR